MILETLWPSNHDLRIIIWELCFYFPFMVCPIICFQQVGWYATRFQRLVQCIVVELSFRHKHWLREDAQALYSDICRQKDLSELVCWFYPSDYFFTLENEKKVKWLWKLSHLLFFGNYVCMKNIWVVCFIGKFLHIFFHTIFSKKWTDIKIGGFS